MPPLRPWSSFETLVLGIGEVDRAAVLAAGRAAQQLLSLRNWIVGTWIIHFEQAGADRAAYGARLLPRLADALTSAGHRGMSARNLANFRLVAAEYPTLNPRALGAEALALPQVDEILQAPAKLLPAPPAGALPWRDAPWIERLFRELSFTHLVEFARIEDPVERAFYELHCLREGWATRDLIRQRNTLLYQRIGLSRDRDTVLALARQGQIDHRPPALLRDPYILEFLGLGEAGVVQESQLEDAMLEHLQWFQPENYGQMKFYVNYLAAEETLPGENPPIGILLCSSKDEETVMFTTPGEHDDVMVARYMLQLPREDQLKQWLHEARVATEARLAPGADTQS